MSWFRRNALGVPAAVPVDQISRAQNGPTFSAGDPALAEYLGIGGGNDAGVSVTETTALGVTAYARGVSIIAGTLAGLPLRTYRSYVDGDGDGDNVRELIPSIFDNPGGDWFTPFAWVELVVQHLVIWGNSFLIHVYNDGGALVALIPVHPSQVTVKRNADYSKTFTVTHDGGRTDYSEADLTHIVGPLSTDGTRGRGTLETGRNALGTAIAGDKAAARMFANGLLIGGLVTSDETLNEDDAKTILAGLKAKLTGTHNAGDIAIVNASLKFSPWTMNADDAQFIESRQHQITEIARLLGIPKVLFAEDGASTWGAGLSELDKGLARYTFRLYSTRIEQALSRLLSNPRHVEFDFHGLYKGTPDEEITALAAQVAAGLLTLDEARAVMNLPALSTPAAAPAQIEGEAA